MNTTNQLRTKEGFLVKSKVLDNEAYHFVQRDERMTWLKKHQMVVSIEQVTIQDGIITCAVMITHNDHHHGIGSCRIDDMETRDHAGLAFKRAIDNALQSMGVGMILKDGAAVSTLNRTLDANEQVQAELAKNGI